MKQIGTHFTLYNDLKLVNILLDLCSLPPSFLSYCSFVGRCLQGDV